MLWAQSTTEDYTRAELKQQGREQRNKGRTEQTNKECSHNYIYSHIVPTGSPSCGGDVKVCVFDINQPSLPTPFTLFLYLFLYCGPFTCISFHKFFRKLSVFSLYSPSLISALLVLSTIYLCIKVSLNGFRDPAHLPCAATCVGGGRDPGDWGNHWLRSVGANTSLWPGLLLDGWLGWPDPINRLVVFSPNFGIRRPVSYTHLTLPTSDLV